MRTFLVALALAALAAAPARADYETGLLALQKGDYARAVAEFEPLATAGNPAAQFNLGRLYQQGYGVPKDAAIARRWFELAANRGLVAAQIALGDIYADG